MVDGRAVNHANEGNVDQEPAASFLRRSMPFRELGRGASVSEPPEIDGGEKGAIRLLKLRDGSQLGSRRVPGVLEVVENGSKGLILERGCAPVGEKYGVQRRCVLSRGNPAVHVDAGGTRIISERDPWGKGNRHANRGVGFNTRGSGSVIVESIVNEQRIVGIGDSVRNVGN
jgi:hypothetical protein